MPDQKPQEGDFLINEPLIFCKGVVLGRLRQRQFSAPGIWVFARRLSRPFDLFVLVIRQPKCNVPRPLCLTHFDVSVTTLFPESRC